ncbi:hypothetical protein [Gordonia sp. 'Campus']|uniref:hypothetical protein n=1 Tax=Gordonia sp. 'Campus' TaxID=2915824 RepID=UPI001EE3C9F0|nr:hypothetical protein [Gordonia sp. 'Campus']
MDDDVLVDADDAEEEFIHNPAAIPDIAAAIDAAASVAGQTLDCLALEASRRLSLPLGDPLARQLLELFHHHIAVAMTDPKRAGAELTSVTSAGSKSCYPVPLADAQEDSVEFWRALSAQVSHPLVVGYLHDILFSRRDGDVGAHLSGAVDAYLEAASIPSLAISARTECAMRAWSLSRNSKNYAGAAVSRRLLAQLTEETFANPQPLPGIALPALAALVTPTSTQGPDQFDIDSLLDRAVKKHGTPDHIDYIAQLLQRNVINPLPEVEAKKLRIRSRITAGDSTTVNHLKLYWYNEAARIAGELGVPELRETSVKLMQAIDPADLEWIRFPVDLSPRPYLVEAFVRNITRDHDWRLAIERWLDTSAPSGSYQRNVDSTKTSLSGLIFHSIFPAQQFGAHGLPERSETATGEGVPDSEVRRTEYFNALTMGGMLALALQRIGEYGPAGPEIEEFLRNSLKCNARDAHVMARAILLFWNGQYLETAYLITPFVESGARRLLLLVNAPLYRVEQNKKIGQFPGLGALLPLLEKEGMDEDWIRFIQTLLLPEGQNLRNLIAHGFTYQVDQIHAALLIRAAAVMMLMPNLPPTGEEESLRKRRGSQGRKRSLRQRFAAAVAAARWAFDA